MIWYIYKTTCLITGKSYVGKHMVKTDSVQKNYLGSGKLLKYAIEKYGRENFVQEILEFTQSEEQNSIRERYWIAELKTQKPNGYNISPGGEGGISGFDPETVGHLSKHRDGKKISQKLVEQKSIVRKLVKSQKLGIVE